jgi:hypothetical protein
MKKLISSTLVSSLIAVCSGCGPEAYYTSMGPDRTQLTLWQSNHGADSSIKITLTDKGHTRTIYEDTDERSISPLHVSWGDGAKRVSILVCNAWGRNILMGFDRDLGRNVTTLEAENAIRLSIEATYHPTTETLKKYDNNSIHWLCKDPFAANAFQERRVRDERLHGLQ